MGGQEQDGQRRGRVLRPGGPWQVTEPEADAPLGVGVGRGRGSVGKLKTTGLS